MFKDEKIDYTNYLKGKPREMDPVKIGIMKARLDQAAIDMDINGELGCTYYTGGRIKVNVNGKFYGVFDCSTGRFFNRYVGDSIELGQPVQS